MTKYHARKVTVGDVTYDSQKEFNRWCDLKSLERAGLISGLQRQVKYVLIPTQREAYERYGKSGRRLKDGEKVLERECAYIADFTYMDNTTRKLIVEDVKGYQKGKAYDLFVIKRKLMLERFGVRVHEI